MSGRPGNAKIWLLIDGHNMAFRCFYGVPQMTTAEGFCVNAIHGWIRSLWRLEDEVSPNAICVFFDSGGSAMRKNILSSYKANRKAMPDNLKSQLKYMNLLSIAHGYHIVSEDGVEADDLLAAFARRVSECGEVAYIASGDKDFAQCVGGNIFQMLPPAADAKGTWRTIGRDGVKEKFGVFPEQIVDYLSLLGDASDNIPGVKGIGAKRAEMFLNRFGNADNILSNASAISSEKIRKNLLNSRELIDRNRKLITLRNSIDFNLPEAKINRSVDDIFDLLKTLQLNSLLSIAQRRYAT
jgi:DNA polymerase-1